ncbi:MAG: hypothetical protein DRP10_00575 [Candidatus Aenigmatarchaeota archaeon]|nr:MAG: hypothetical protein DRP10_00575 [Candidatus Aenigmarchaeota archaeon]
MKIKKFKGITPLISSILIVGILAIITGLAYEWGMPMIQKNIDITTLNKAENFLRELDKKIDDVAKLGGSEELIFNLPGEITINPENNTIEFFLKTSGSIYMQGGFVCFSRNCNLTNGIWGKDSYSVIGVQVDQFEEYATITTYKIIYRNLTSDTKTYILDVVTPQNVTLVGSENSRLLIKKLGEERGKITKTIIWLDIR